MPKVYIKFPKTGLGNMMLVWARGIVFAKINNIPVVTSSWWGLHWGALIRREQRNRLYWGYFKETPLLKQFAVKWYTNKNKIVYEPVVQKVDDDYLNQHHLFIFNKVITDDDLFLAIRNHKDIIIKELYDNLSTKIKFQVEQYSTPVIGIHIRRGDFKLGNQTTPLSYFIKGVNIIRSVLGGNTPVTIFTDASKEEIKDILELPYISIAEKKPDILDILLLSKSKVMILSQSSTFSYWGAFLSDALVVRPINDWQKKIGIASLTGNYSETLWHYDNEASTKELIQKLSTYHKSNFLSEWISE
jgi:hypothetical protein